MKNVPSRILATSIILLCGLLVVLIVHWFQSKVGGMSLDNEYHSPHIVDTRITTISASYVRESKESLANIDHSNSTMFTHSTTSLERVLLESAGLQGSTIDGGLSQNQYGELVIGSQLRNFFDYLLLVEDLWGRNKLREWFALYATSVLDIQAAKQAYGLFGDYLEYLDAVELLEPPFYKTSELNQLLVESENSDFVEAIRPEFINFLEQRKQVRGRYLSEEVQTVFFAEEDHSINTALHRVTQQTGLKAVSENQANYQTLNVQGRFDEYQQLIKVAALPLSDTELMALREVVFGSDAANRLMALDAQRKEWQERIKRFKYSRNQILQSTNDSETIHLLVGDLLLASFQPNEIPRVEAIVRLSTESLTPSR